MILKASFPSLDWNINVLVMHTHQDLRLNNIPIKKNGQRVLEEVEEELVSQSSMKTHISKEKIFKRDREYMSPTDSEVAQYLVFKRKNQAP